MSSRVSWSADPQRRVLIVLMLATAASAAGYGVMFTVLDEYRDQFGMSDFSLGAIVAVGFFTSFLVQVFLAPLADRGFAHRLILLGTLVGAAGMAMMAFGSTVAVLGLGRAVMGLGAGLITPAARRIVILANPSELGRNVGRLLIADVAGFALGPAVSAVLVGPFGLAAPFLVMMALSLALLPVLQRIQVDEASPESAPPTRFSLDLLRERTFTAAVCFGAAVFVMIGFFDALWVLVLDDLGAADWIANIGIVLFAVPLLFLGSIGGRLAQRLGPFRVATVGLTIGAVAMFSYGHWSSGGVMFAVAMVHGLNDGLTVSASGVAVGMVAPSERMASAQGVLGGVQTLVGGLAALGAGWLKSEFGRAAAYGACAAAMLVLIAGGVALSGRRWSERPGVVS
jgi:MFS family permease